MAASVELALPTAHCYVCPTPPGVPQTDRPLLKLFLLTLRAVPRLPGTAPSHRRRTFSRPRLSHTPGRPFTQSCRFIY